MSVPAKLSLKTAERDRWHCRYTGEPVWLAAWFQLQHMLGTGVRYNKNSRADATDPLAVSHSMQIDHLIANANGGTNDPVNLYTSAARPNIQKGRATDWKPLPITDDTSWDGGLREFLALVRARPWTLKDGMVNRWYRAATELGL